MGKNGNLGSNERVKTIHVTPDNPWTNNPIRTAHIHRTPIHVPRLCRIRLIQCEYTSPRVSSNKK